MIRARRTDSCENCGQVYVTGARLAWRMVDMGTLRQRFQFCPDPPCWTRVTSPASSEVQP